VGDYPQLPRTYQRPPRDPPEQGEQRATERSNAAIPVVVVVVGVGLYLGVDSLLVPAALGLVLLLAGLSFLSTRLNPLSPHFYLTRKPSWAAVGVDFLGALALLAEAYALWTSGGAAHLLPHV
jgi:hypothetical protein